MTTLKLQVWRCSSHVQVNRLASCTRIATRSEALPSSPPLPYPAWSLRNDSPSFFDSLVGEGNDDLSDKRRGQSSVYAESKICSFTSAKAYKLLYIHHPTMGLIRSHRFRLQVLRHLICPSDTAFQSATEISIPVDNASYLWLFADPVSHLLQHARLSLHVCATAVAILDLQKPLVSRTMRVPVRRQVPVGKDRSRRRRRRW
jgi:hypothetical protein